VLLFPETRSIRLKRLTRISCLACDLDGTLLRGDNTVSEHVRRACASLMDAGVHLVLASGRTDGFTRMYAEDIGTQSPVVSLNGALVRDASQNTLFASRLPSALQQVITGLQQRGDLPCSICLFTEAGIYVEEANPPIPRYLRSNPEDIFHIASLTAMYDQAVLIVLSGSYTVLQQYSIAISRRFRRKLQRILYQSGSGGDLFYLEIRNASANKAQGLRVVLQKLGLHRRQAAAIGDYTNDIELCKFSGVSASMRNGCEELKAVTDLVTLRSNEEDGVAEFISLILSHRTQ
jgi:5-amino-6-(5-phospho-D-ribitylamino)uracil phosphatase